MDSAEQSPTQPDPNFPYLFWLPPEDRRVKVGPEQLEVPLPQLPLPIKSSRPEAELAPTDVEIGSSLYDYLRQYPDCQYNSEYAELLRDAYPHYISDLGAQAVMLSHKDVAAPYLQRLVNYLKILLLLDPGNRGLQHQLGSNHYRLAMNFESLIDCRKHLYAAKNYLQASLQDSAADAGSLNLLAHIDYLSGDYPAATRAWKRLLPLVDAPGVVADVEARLRDVEAGDVPQRPLLDDLEQVGEAMILFGAGDYAQAKLVLEVIEEQGALCQALPMAEFFYLLGMCRVKSGDPAAAFESFEKALEIDPEYEVAISARDDILKQGG